MPYLYVTEASMILLLLQSLGADEWVDYKKDKFEELYSNDHFDVVLDLVGGESEADFMLMPVIEHFCFIHARHGYLLPTELYRPLNISCGFQSLIQLILKLWCRSL